MALKPLPTVKKLPTIKQSPVPKPIISTGTGDIPWYISTPAADIPGFSPSAPVQATPTSMAPYTNYATPAAASRALGLAPAAVSNPNQYMKDLTSDPMYQSALDAYTAAVAGRRQSLKDQIRAAVIRSGFNIRPFMTGRLADYAGDITDADVAAAAADPTTAKAQLDRQLGRQQNELGYGLAGRGMLRSGDLVSGNSLLQEGYDQETTNQMNSLLAALQGGVSDYGDYVSQQELAKQQAFADIANRLANQQGPVYPLEDGGIGADYSYGSDMSGVTPSAPSAPSAPTPPAAAPAAPAALKWGGQVFTTKAAFDQWARLHGTTTQKELANNPAARAIYGGLR